MGLFGIGKGLVGRVAAFFSGRRADGSTKATSFFGGKSKEPEVKKPVPAEEASTGRHSRHSMRGQHLGCAAPGGRWLSPMSIRLKVLDGMSLAMIRQYYGRKAAAYASKFVARREAALAAA